MCSMIINYKWFNIIIPTKRKLQVTKLEITKLQNTSLFYMCPELILEIS